MTAQTSTTQLSTARSDWSLEQWWDSAESWDHYLARVQKHPQLWHGVHDRVRLPDDLPDPSAVRECAHLLAIAEDWCGDAANSLPVAAHLAKHFGIELRVLERDKNFPPFGEILGELEEARRLLAGTPAGAA